MISKKNFYRYAKEASKEPGCWLLRISDTSFLIEFHIGGYPIGVEVVRAKRFVGIDIYNFPQKYVTNGFLQYTSGYKIEKVPRLIELVRDYLIENGGFEATKKRERESKTYYSFAEYCARHDQSVFTEEGIFKYV